MVSNQFVEIKGAVFKRFEKENLFQLGCADIVERFQLTLYLVIIGWRNVVALGSDDIQKWSQLWQLVIPLVLVYGSELFVDWLKHAFITKFNHITPSVYQRFFLHLCRDFNPESDYPRKRDAFLFS